MSGVLVVAEHRQGNLRDVTAEMVTAAADLGGPVAVAVLSPDPSAFRSGVDLAGVDEVIEVKVPAAEFENDIYQSVVEALIRDREPDAVLLGFSVDSMAYGAALATKLNLGFVSDVFGLGKDDGGIVCTRAMYGGKVQAEVELPKDRTAVIMLRPATWEAASGAGSATVTEFSPGELRASRARHREFVEAPATDVDITTADLLLSVGRGIGDKDNLPRFEALAEKMSATLSASRPLIDSGWLPSARQVGQSGKTVKPKVYLAMGISGAVQHLAGMKTSGTIIAVNSDPEAAIFSVAHYGVVADLYDILDELEEIYE